MTRSLAGIRGFLSHNFSCSWTTNYDFSEGKAANSSGRPLLTL